MPEIEAQNKGLYVLVLLAGGFTAIAALGPGLCAGDHAHSISSWQYLVFNKICHQDPLRSFQLSGVQMAVCSRCLGIYTSFFLGWITLPVMALLSPGGVRWERILLGTAILLNLTDITGNFLGIWTNTLNSRFWLGSIFGFSAAIFLMDEFFKRINKPEE